MQIQSLFPENIPVEVFDVPNAMSKAERMHQMELAAKTEKNRECVKEFRKFLINFNQTFSNFIIADVIEGYKKAGLPQPGTDWRCCGGAVNKLIKDGVLIPTGEKRFLTDGTNREMMIYRGLGVGNL